MCVDGDGMEGSGARTSVRMLGPGGDWQQQQQQQQPTHKMQLVEWQQSVDTFANLHKVIHCLTDTDLTRVHMGVLHGAVFLQERDTEHCLKENKRDAVLIAAEACSARSLRIHGMKLRRLIPQMGRGRVQMCP